MEKLMPDIHEGSEAIKISFTNDTREVARISPDGIMRFTVEANDENAARFVECIEWVIKKRLNGIEVETKSA